MTGLNPSLRYLDNIPSSPISDLHNIPVSRSFKYLNIYVTPRHTEYAHLHLSSLLVHIQDKVKVWTRLKLTLVGKTNLKKKDFYATVSLYHTQLPDGYLLKNSLHYQLHILIISMAYQAPES